MSGLRSCGHPLGPSAHCSECAWEEYRKGPPLASLHGGRRDTACQHGVRWPHQCDDCDRRDIPPGKSIREHPCYRQAGELSHRAIVGVGPIHCERCGTELDQRVKQKAGAPLSWEPRAGPTVMRNSAFQGQVGPWLLACFGPEIAGDREERNHRFLEEALELVQACGCTASEAHQLVDYVFGRPIGEPRQEAGGVMVTLAALCLANAIDMHEAGWTELQRIWTKVEQIRAKQATKPKHSPLPEALR